MAPWESVAAVHEPPDGNARMRHGGAGVIVWGRIMNHPDSWWGKA